MDVFRFLRALEARSIESIEKLRSDYLEGGDNKPKPTPDQWKQIERNDRLMDRLEKGNDG